MGRPEAKIEMYLVDRAEQEGVFMRKAEWIARSGCPDRYGAKAARQAWVECKSETGELSDIQRSEIERMRNAGIIVFVVANRAEVDHVIAWFNGKPFMGGQHMITFVRKKKFDA